MNIITQGPANMYNGHLLSDPACSAVNADDSSDDQPVSSGSSRDFDRRFRHSRRNMISSIPTIDNDSMTEVVIDDLAENEPTSAILDFCKRKFLRPYVHLLGFAGLHPISADTTCCRACVSHLQTTIVLMLICLGYFLQYMSSFRRDRGIYANSSDIYTLIYNQPYHRDSHDLGELIFVYFIPSCLHFIGFLCAIYVFRIADNEQLQNLVERVYLLSEKPKKLCIVLWLYILCGVIGLGLLLTYVILTVLPRHEIIQSIRSEKPGEEVQRWGKILLILTMGVHDAVQIAVLTSYCIQCHLLTLHLGTLKDKLVQHTIETLEWMKEILEFRKLLNNLNRRVATPICFFTVMNLSYAFSSLVYLFEAYEWDYAVKTLALNIANFTFWLLIGLIPFFQAASVTRACKSAQASGHQIRVRPFVYHNSSSHDLDSTLLFASSLNMSAKLYRMPIQGNYLCCSILIISIIIITLGMCLNFSLGTL